jgi:SecD/SecF fusion protein
MTKFTKCGVEIKYKWLSIITISILLMISACSYKTGNKHVKISMRLDDTTQNISTSISIIKNRLMSYGIHEKNFKIAIHNTIIDIDVEHVDNPKRVIFLITTPGKLEFWEMFDKENAKSFLDQANKSLAAIINSSDSLIVIGSDTIMKSKANKKDNSANGKIDTLSIKQRIRQNPLLTYILPNDTKEEGIQGIGPRPFFGYVKIEDTGKVNQMLKMCYNKNVFPKNMKVLWTVKPRAKDSLYLELISIKVPTWDGIATLGGEVVVDAHYETNYGNNEISITMNEEGTRIWRRFTYENIGKPIAIVFDDHVFSYPTIQSEIADGKSQIAGNFTKEEAEDFATILKFHWLPVHSILNITVGEEAK